MSHDLPAHWRPFQDAMARGDGAAAERALAQVVQLEPDQGTAFHRISLVAYRTGNIAMGIGFALKACQAPPADLGLRMDLATHLVLLGEGEAAHGLCLGVPEGAPAAIHLRCARELTSLEDFPAAARSLDHAARQGLPAAELARFRARLHAALGNFDAAEAGFVQALEERTMAELDAAYLSRLRTWTPAHNHVAAMESALADCAPGAPHIAGYAYGLHKQYHDLGDYPRAWDMLQRGCAAKRASLAYDPEADSELMAGVASLPAHRGNPSEPDPDDPVPIFILGLPRAGSTLVERILGNHAQVESAGELKDFMVQLRRLAGLRGVEPLDAPLLARMPQVDAGELGRSYMAHVRWRLGGRRCFIDKNPLNYLYVGLIRAALPQAKIIHAHRDPMDACFSIYKFVFPWLYPYSYDQQELGCYYLRYRQVMAHWHQLYPGAILDVPHEALLRDPEAAVARILAYCGLDPEPGLTRLDRNAAPAATGSNAQVRDGITTRYAGQWQCYAAQLEPLRRLLGTAGLA